jgi:hypothetical protein
MLLLPSVPEEGGSPGTQGGEGPVSRKGLVAKGSRLRAGWEDGGDRRVQGYLAFHSTWVFPGEEDPIPGLCFGIPRMGLG